MQQSDATRLCPEFLSAKSVGILLDLSARTVWLKARKGELPQPIYVGNGVPRWVRKDVMNAILMNRKFGKKVMPKSRKPKAEQAQEAIDGAAALQRLGGIK